jgi:ATP-dependent Clp protease protease subunit
MLTSTHLDTKERQIVLMGSVDEQLVKSTCEKIFEINEFDNIKENEIANYERRPIFINISTYGGQVYAGLSLYGVIENSKTKIITVARGHVMSMGLILFLAGHEKQAHKFSTFLYHEVATGIFDKLEGIKQDLKEAQRLQNLLDEIVLSKTLITKEKIDEVKKHKQDWFIPAFEAIKLGICENII